MQLILKTYIEFDSSRSCQFHYYKCVLQCWFFFLVVENYISKTRNAYCFKQSKIQPAPHVFGMCPSIPSILEILNMAVVLLRDKQLKTLLLLVAGVNKLTYAFYTDHEQHDKYCQLVDIYIFPDFVSQLIINPIFQNLIIPLNGYVQIDHSIVESFGAEGKACITARVYPTLVNINDAQAHLYVFNNGTENIGITRLSAWSMKKAQIN